MPENCLLIANWKLTHSQRTSHVWLSSFKDLYQAHASIQVGIAPSFTELHFVSQELPKMQLDAVQVVSQSVSAFAQGKYTGEVGAFQLSDVGVSIGLVGHSERRSHLQESTQSVNEQIFRLLEQRIQPLIAVSEISQVEAVLSTHPDASNFIWVYEPLSAIGSGNPADPAEVKKMLQEMRRLTSANARCLYGGSVSAETVAPYLQLPQVEGFLVGTASVDVIEFMGLHKAIAEAYE